MQPDFNTLQRPRRQQAWVASDRSNEPVLREKCIRAIMLTTRKGAQSYSSIRLKQCQEDFLRKEESPGNKEMAAQPSTCHLLESSRSS